MSHQPCVSKAFLRSMGVCPSRTPASGKSKNNKNRAMRARLLKEDPYCYYCGCRLTLDDSTLDHALPVSKGGRTIYSNVVLACYECNQDKGDKIIVVWGRQ